jgi:DNA-binding PadR family transcriptional regulator
MALEHALLVSLREQPASGLDLTRRFERSIGQFWRATHQQIYRVLGRMEQDGLVVSHTVEQHGAANKRVYRVTPAGEAALAGWLAEPAAPDPARSDLAVKMRGASFGGREAVLDVVEQSLHEHRERLDRYRAMRARDYPDPSILTGLALDQYLVLRGGILTEESYVAWLLEYLSAHGRETV